MNKTAIPQRVHVAKEKFNTFFRDDLYGQFDKQSNTILSRGAWNDDVVALPAIFTFCLQYTLSKHWVGYSDSLGHERVYPSLLKRFNYGIAGAKYTEKMFALTLGNTTTLGFVYRELAKQLPADTKVIMTKPFYPSIAKSITHSFSSIDFIDGLETEEVIIKDLKQSVVSDKKAKIIHLSNFIGVEGRIFSKSFWEDLLAFTEPKGVYVVIDEGLWYKEILYPDSIVSSKVIRLVSPSKKYGIPGMKIGVMIAPETFIHDFYEQASTSYGGPASIFFLLLEMLFLFEYVYLSKDHKAFSQLKHYDISDSKIRELYENYTDCLKKNELLYDTNRDYFENWLKRNRHFVHSAHLFNGINFFIRFNTAYETMYAFFQALIEQRGVSVMPGICFGDIDDKYIRISVLEDHAEFKKGLQALELFLKDTK